MRVKKIYQYKEGDIKIPTKFKKCIGNIAPEVLILMARNNELTELKGIGEKRAKDITDIIDKAGYIFHESRRSRAIRYLLKDLRDPKTRGINAIAEYENRKEFSVEDLELVFNAFDIDRMPVRFKNVLELYYGFHEKNYSIEEIAHKRYGRFSTDQQSNIEAVKRDLKDAKIHFTTSPEFDKLWEKTYSNINTSP